MKKATDLNQTELPSEEHSLGLSNGNLGDGYLSASSFMDSYSQAWQGRLNNEAKNNMTHGAWCSKEVNKNQYLQIDFGDATKVGAIATQGRPDYEEDGGWFVQTYTVAFSNDGENWNNYKEFGIPKVFEGNQDYDTVVVNQFKIGINARYLRIKPVTWHNHIAMRAELYKDTKSKAVPNRGRGQANARSSAEQRRQANTNNQRGDTRNQRLSGSGAISIQLKHKEDTAEQENHVETRKEVPEDKKSPKPINTQSQGNSHVIEDEISSIAAGVTRKQEVEKEIQRPKTIENEGESVGKVFTRLTKQGSAVTSSEGGKYIGKIKLIKKESLPEPEIEVKVEKKDIDCDITPVVKQRIRDMSSGTVEQSNLQRKSMILDEEIKYTEDMEAKVNQRVEMFREAEKRKKEREEAERLELERRKQEKLKRTERRMQDSSDGSPAHSEGGKSDFSDGSIQNGPLNMAERAMKAQTNGTLGESWENLSIEGQEERRSSLELEQKLESIETEHAGYDPDKERVILEQTEEAFRSYAEQGKQSPNRKPQGNKTSMLIKSFSVVQDSSEKPSSLRRQVSEPKTPSKMIEQEEAVPVTVIDTESAFHEEVTSSTSSTRDDTQDIEIGFVRKASARLKMTSETEVDGNQKINGERTFSPEVTETIAEPEVENVSESVPVMDEVIHEHFIETVESEPVDLESPRSVLTRSSESDLKDIESGLVRRVTQRFKDQPEPKSVSMTPKVRPKPLLSTNRSLEVKERSASSGSEASEPYVSESMSLEFLMKEVSETQSRVQGGERHVAIAKERLEQCQASSGSSEAIEAEEEYHEACLELSRLRKKLLRLQKQIKETGNDVEIDFKGLDRAGAPLAAPTLKSDKETIKVSKECKAPPEKEPPPVDISVYNDEGECVPEGNVLSQIKAFEKLKAR